MYLVARLEATEDESQFKIKQLRDSFTRHAGELQLKVDAMMKARDYSTLLINSKAYNNSQTLDIFWIFTLISGQLFTCMSVYTI